MSSRSRMDAPSALLAVLYHEEQHAVSCQFMAFCALCRAVSRLRTSQVRPRLLPNCHSARFTSRQRYVTIPMSATSLLFLSLLYWAEKEVLLLFEILTREEWNLGGYIYSSNFALLSSIYKSPLFLCWMADTIYYRKAMIDRMVENLLNIESVSSKSYNFCMPFPFINPCLLSGAVSLKLFNG